MADYVGLGVWENAFLTSLLRARTARILRKKVFKAESEFDTFPESCFHSLTGIRKRADAVESKEAAPDHKNRISRGCKRQRRYKFDTESVGEGGQSNPEDRPADVQKKAAYLGTTNFQEVFRC
jgi:hypothetical protein